MSKKSRKCKLWRYQLLAVKVEPSLLSRSTYLCFATMNTGDATDVYSGKEETYILHYNRGGGEERQGSALGSRRVPKHNNTRDFGKPHAFKSHRLYRP